MGIDSAHPLYSAMLPIWKRCRDAYEGEDAVKKAGETYLPRMSAKQPPQEYEAYKQRASYYGAVARTIDGFVGAIARKSHSFTLPAKIAHLEHDTTGDGVGINEFVRAMSGEDMLQGRLGVLVDIDPDGKPFLTYYTAESITNWSNDSVVVFETVFEADPKDPYATVAVGQYRQFYLADGAYTVTKWRKLKVAGQTREQWVPVETVQPTMSGRLMGQLPWFWCSMLGVTSRLTKPPLLGLVNVALSHYRSSADLEHGRHFAGRPTLYITGWDPEGGIQVGGASALIIPNEDAKVGYAEFTGQGLGSLEKALESKEHQIAAMGAAAFAKGAARSEPVVTANVRASGETSLLAAVTAAVEETLTDALQFAAQWVNAAGDVKVSLNKDFAQEVIDPQTLTGLIAALQMGAIDLPTFLYTLEQSDLLAPTSDYLDLAKQLQAGFDARLAALTAKPTQGAPAKPSAGAAQ
jgi:hypothetical protein